MYNLNFFYTNIGVGRNWLPSHSYPCHIKLWVVEFTNKLFNKLLINYFYSHWRSSSSKRSSKSIRKTKQVLFKEKGVFHAMIKFCIHPWGMMTNFGLDCRPVPVTFCCIQIYENRITMVKFWARSRQKFSNGKIRRIKTTKIWEMPRRTQSCIKSPMFCWRFNTAA